jgi:hypothetical protein
VGFERSSFGPHPPDRHERPGFPMQIVRMSPSRWHSAHHLGVASIVRVVVLPGSAHRDE